MLGGLGKTGAIGSSLATALRPKGIMLCPRWVCCVPVGFSRWILYFYSYSGVRRYSYSVWAFSQRLQDALGSEYGTSAYRDAQYEYEVGVPFSNGQTPGNRPGDTASFRTWNRRGHGAPFPHVEGNCRLCWGAWGRRGPLDPAWRPLSARRESCCVPVGCCCVPVGFSPVGFVLLLVLRRSPVLVLGLGVFAAFRTHSSTSTSTAMLSTSTR